MARCEHCGMRNLKWAKTRDGWRLYDKYGHRHQCLGGKRHLSDAEFKRQEVKRR
jgi:hypothetical protein